MCHKLRVNLLCMSKNKRKNFIYKNEEFICEHCKTLNPKASKIRNHCKHCLSSKHLDELPGDRKANCEGLMLPLFAEIDKKRGYMITHECTKCGFRRRNQSLEDDNFDMLIDLIANYNKMTLENDPNL